MGNGTKDIETKEKKPQNGKLSLHSLKFEDTVKALLEVKPLKGDKDGSGSSKQPKT